MEQFNPQLVVKAHAQLIAAMAKEGFAPADKIAQAPPMDPSMGGAPPMDPSMAGGAPPMDPSMAGGAPPMPPPAMGGGAPPMPGGGAPPMPPEGAMPPVQVGFEDLMALFTQIAQEAGGGAAAGGADTAGVLSEITERLSAIEAALGVGAAGAPPVPGEMGAMPPATPMPSMGEAMSPMMEATAAPMPGMPVSAYSDAGQIKSGKAEKIGDLVARLRRK